MTSESNANSSLGHMIVIGLAIFLFGLLLLVFCTGAQADEVAEWRMDEGAGQWANDTSGNGNDGTLGANVSANADDPAWTVDGISGTALDFDGMDDFVYCGNDTSLRITGDVTVSAWINIETIVDFADVVEFGYDGETLDTNTLYEIRITAGGDIYYFHEYGIGSNELNVFDANLDAGEWHHIAITRDIGTNEVRLYVNGLQVDSTFTYANDPEGGAAGFAYIGVNMIETSPIYFNGTIDEVRIWNHTLTPGEISDYYHATAPPVRNANTGAYYDSLQAAVDAATSGDELVIYHGHFTGGLLVDGKNISIVDSGFELAGDLAVIGGGSLTIDPTWMNVTGNVWVDAGSTLVLDATVLQLNSSYDGEFGIQVNGTGTLNILNGSVVRSQTAFAYRFDVLDLAAFVVENSTIRDCGWNASNPGLWVDADGAYLYRVALTNNYNGITLNSSSNSQILYSTIYSYTSTGIDLINSDNNSMSGNDIMFGDAYSPPTSGLVGYWKMDEAYWNGTADEIADSSGQGNHGTANGDANTASDSRFDRAGDFDGAGDYVNCGSGPSLMLTGNMTMEFWMNAADLSNSPKMVAWGANGETGPTNYLYMIWINPSGTITMFHEYGSGSNQQYTTAGSYITTDTWHHMAAVRDAAAMEWHIYVDGLHRETLPYTNNTADGSGGSLFLGSDAGPGNFYDGLMDEVHIYNRSLSADEVRAFSTGMGARGIHLENSINNTVSGNRVSYNQFGIFFDSSDNNTVFDNDIYNNEEGIHLNPSRGNTISGALAPLPEAVTDNDRHDRAPQVNLHGNAVWRGYDGSDYEIFFWDGATITQLTDNAGYDYDPQLNDNGEVVWSRWDGGNEEIFFWDGVATTQVTNNAEDDHAPKINGNGEVVWYGNDGSDDEIFFWDGATITQLTDNAEDDYEPQLNDNGRGSGMVRLRWQRRRDILLGRRNHNAAHRQR